MEADFWHARWDAMEIGFHEGEANDLLVRHLPSLDLAEGARIFVPLCGKAHDMAWLAAQGFEVVGVELSAKAVGQFFEEMDVAPEIAGHGSLTRFSAGSITIYAGDLFALDGATLSGVDAVYDRASLVAMPASMRDNYAHQVRALTPAAKRLLITFAYDQSQMEGPPFSINTAEVERLFAGDYDLTCLEERDVEGGLKGRIPATEAAWRMIPR
ncbi:thiopurine S-methyltransferase [Croceicoccus gelatinilyticus]|uniref:thiopurine S-methyltransferase n=1 Tax=Croceicoccus gelatinilyticus TaxID=2835536 RepID=UPI001BCEEF37|nr:thiopurine S-methyltransferase [Croceicoccus gelatinilyticus]MBS7668308.1 thiopurine S-methyltransferase [Croceicoccus gelatinilyticus]